jgi:integrase
MGPLCCRNRTLFYLCGNTFIMATVNFYLKEPTSEVETPIFLQFKYKGQRFKYSIGQSIHPANWNPKKQRVKNTRATTKEGDALINDLLEGLSKKVENTYKGSLGIPVPSEFKRVLDEYRDEQSNSGGRGESKQSFFGLIDRFINNEILHKGKERVYNTIKSYKTTKGHLEEFEKKNKYKITFDSINLDFYYQFVSFLKKKGLAPNSIGKDIKDIKTFMREAVDMELTDNLQFEKSKFSVIREETHAVYLKESEIIKLYQCDLSSQPRLEQVRDLFVFGCFVGLRFSDFSDVKPENVQEIDSELFLRVKTKKMGNRVTIPCNQIVKEIFKKYDSMPNKLPRAISNQKFNDYVKEACKIAGLVEKGRLENNTELELWESISSHTARRSFATNLYNEGFPVLDIMKITGHKTEKAFLRYIKFSDEDSAKKLSAHNKKKDWSKILLKVA